MPFIKPISFQIVEPKSRKGLNLGHSDELQNKATEHKLPLKLYHIYAPVVGFNRLLLGIAASREEYLPKFSELLQMILTGQFATHKEDIKKTIASSYEIASAVIHQLYFNLSKIHTPWDTQKEKVLTQYKEIFRQLEEFGGQWCSIRTTNSKEFADLASMVFNTDSLTKALGDAESGGDKGFAKFKELADIYLPLGANINAPMVCNPDFGTFLHYYLAFEHPYPVELIRFIESKRNTKTHTQFDYATKDGFGNTPLLIALMTRQENAVLELLALNQKGKEIGINIVDNNGRSPLLIAAALGMKNVVVALLKQGANPLAKDKNGLGLSDYAAFNKKQITEMVSPFLHAERSSKVNHSYLYCNDTWKTPLCFYETGEQEKTGDEQIPHFVVLSPVSPHKEKLERVAHYLDQEAKLGTKEAKTLLPFVTEQIKQVLETKSFLEVSLNGQELVRAYLSPHEMTESIRLYKEKQLRQACALGQLDIIKILLEEGVDPNAKDELQRTALHYAVMREELVQKIIDTEAWPKGTLIQAKYACEQHSVVIGHLCTYSQVPVNFAAKNKAGNTAEAILLREARSANLVDAQSASACLEKIQGINKVDIALSPVVQEHSSSYTKRF